MTTRANQTPLRINSYRIGAALTQLGSYLTTYAFMYAVLKPTPGQELGTILISAGVEFVLLLGKKLLFDREHKNDAVGWSATLLDTVLNAGGLWPYVERINSTPPALMLVQALHLNGDVSGAPGLVIALACGYILAIAPHRLWRAGANEEK